MKIFIIFVCVNMLGKLSANNTTMNTKFKVFITNPTIIETPLKLLEESNCELIRVPLGGVNSSNMIKILQDVNGVDAIIWSGHVKSTSQILDAAGPQLKIFATVSAGYDHLNLTDLKERGIMLSNTPGVLNAAVADTAVMLALAASRRLHEGRQKIVNNEWTSGFQWMLGQDLAGSTVGIVGLGGIGQSIAKRLKAFDIAELVYTGHKPKKAGDELGAKFVSLNELLEASDFVIASVPLTPETRHMFNKTVFDKMKSTSVFVNIGRGDLVNQDDLIDALKSKKIFAAGLDVMTPEPLPYDHPLTQLSNCVLMPHLASATIKTRTAMVELAVKNVLAALNNKPLITPVLL